MKNLAHQDLSYSNIDDKGVLHLIAASREGIKYARFQLIANNSPFSTKDWSVFLHLTERTLQRYKKEKKSFEPAQTERIIEVALLYKYGTEVFGDKHKFDTWLDTENIALGKVKPKSLFDTTFGIRLLKDELTRIEHGVLA